MAKKAKSPSPFEGRWRITAMKVWSQDVVDAEVEGFVEFGPNGVGSFQFAYVSGDIDYRDSTRDGKPSVEWSWDGNDELDQAKGSGWAMIDGDKIRGVIAILHGDQSKFEAIRKEQTGSKKRAIKKPVEKAEKPKLFPAQAPALASDSEKVAESVTNIFDDLPQNLPKEVVQALIRAADVRIERIISHGHASPADFWYDQPQHEWVIVLKGAARLQFEDGMVEMKPGDFINIPAFKKHRVDWTTPDEPTVWLGVRYGGTT
jgi:cupin 2 domain-containing protein